MRGYSTIQHDVFDTYKQAVSDARQYIYIENQYFRDKSFTKLLIDQLKRQKDLQIIVLLPVAAEEKPNDFTRHADFIQHGLIEKLQAADNKRVGVYSVRRSRGGDIYVHAKVMMVDDKWATIGSANTNPRSFFLDSEINIVVRDEAFAKDLRMSLWKEHLQMTDQSKLDITNSKRFVELWNGQANENDEHIKKGQSLKGRVHTHHAPKGAEIDLSKLISNPLERVLLPDLNDYI